MSRPTTFDFPRIESLPAELQQEVASRRGLNVYRMIMHTPGVAPAFLVISDALRQRTSLPGNLREVAILRVGHRYDAAYEVHHHERLGRSVGLSESALTATRLDADDASLTQAEKQIVQLTDELLRDHGLSAESRDRALSFLTTNQLTDFVLTVGYYQMVCNFLNTFAVPIEAAATGASQ